MRLQTMIMLAGIGLAAGCTTDETQRLDGMTYGAGNAMAANTVMQMVDPWQYGVQHTDLDVPADRATAVSTAPGSTASDASASASTSSTTGSSN